MILNGWKEIAQYLGRDIRTVRRWEHLGLPVRRPKHKDRSAVVALSEELDEWSKADAKPQLAAPATGNTNTASGPFKRRVLVVDDDEGLLVTIAAILANQGYEVRTARDGFEALAAMRISLPDILVTDLRMPNMSGFELLAVVRRRFPAIGVIAISGEFTPVTLPDILADGYVEKGVNSIFELIEAVRELFSQIPVRAQPAKPDSAPAWIPRSANGYIVLTCLDCLRSFSIATRVLQVNTVASETCVHCGQEVRYCLDQTVLPVAAELPTLLDSALKTVEENLFRIEHTKSLIHSSKNSSAQEMKTPRKKTV